MEKSEAAYNKYVKVDRGMWEFISRMCWLVHGALWDCG